MHPIPAARSTIDGRGPCEPDARTRPRRSASRSSTRTCRCFPTSPCSRTSPSTRSSAARSRPPPRARDARDRAGGARAARCAPAARRAASARCRSPQRQIVAICRGLAANARLLFMDEPTASLTRHEVDLLLAIVRRLKAHGVAVVFVSHRLDEVVEIAERVTVLRDGRKVGTFPAAEVDDHRLAELMTGSRIEHTVSARAASKRASPCWRCAALAARGEFEDVSFTLHARRGARPHRAARRRAHRAGAGSVRHDAGSIAARSCSMARRSRLRSNQDAIAPASPMSPRIGCRSASTCGSRSPTTSRSSRARPAGRTASGLVSPRAPERMAADWVERLDIKIAGRRRGRCRRCPAATSSASCSAKWLATKPKVLILDSPTVGVDIRNKQGIYERDPRSWRERGRRHPPDLRRDAGGLLQLPTACCTCATAGSSANSFRATSSEHDARGGGLCVGVLRAALRPHRDGAGRRRSSSPAIVFSVSSPYFLTLVQPAVDLIESLFGHDHPRRGRVRGAGVRRHRHLVRRHRLGRAVSRRPIVGDALRRAGAARPSRWPALLGIALGCINALLTYYLRVASIIVTIATIEHLLRAAHLFHRRHARSTTCRTGGRTRVVVLPRPRPPTATSSRITLPIVVMVAVVAAHPAPDDPHRGRPPDLCAGRQSRGGEPGRHRHPAASSSSSTAISASWPASPGCVQAHRVHQAVPDGDGRQRAQRAGRGDPRRRQPGRRHRHRWAACCSASCCSPCCRTG